MNHIQNKKLSIAVIGLKGLPAFGGAATVGQNIINNLHEQFDFTVLAVESHARYDFIMGNVEQVIFDNFPVKKLNILFYYIKSCIYVLLSSKFDLVHLHHTDGAFILPFLRLKYKVVLTSHARPQLLSKWSKIVKYFFSLNEYIAIWLANVFTSVSIPLQKIYQQKYKRDIIYIPNGVDLKIASEIERIDSNKEPYILFSAGRILPSKGLHLLIEALKKLRYKGKVKVAGNLDQLPDYKSSLLQLSNDLNIEFLGLIKDKKELLTLVKNAKLFVFPSLTEAMSIMLLEAALMKTPIICSDISANKAVFDKDEVMYFNSNDVNDLVGKLWKAMDEEELMQRISLKAYHKLEKAYTWDKISIEYSKLYFRYG